MIPSRGLIMLGATFAEHLGPLVLTRRLKRRPIPQGPAEA